MFVQIKKRCIVRLDQINNVYQTTAGTMYVTLLGSPEQEIFTVEPKYVENILLGLESNQGLFSYDNVTFQDVFKNNREGLIQ